MSAMDGEGAVVDQPVTGPTAAGLRELDRPSLAQATRQVALARQLFGRSLAPWAADLLRLRRAAGNVPRWRTIRHDSEWRQAA